MPTDDTYLAARARMLDRLEAMVLEGRLHPGYKCEPVAPHDPASCDDCHPTVAPETELERAAARG